MNRTNPLSATALSFYLILSTIACAILPAGCSPAGPLDESTIRADAVVARLEIEGGCWVLDTGRERYEPVNLGEAFRRDGLEVAFTARIRDDMASICQVGRLVEIVEIRER